LPVYDLAAVAEAVDLEPKQLDNLLSRNDVPGVDRKKRGVARRLNADVAVIICLARELSQALEIPLGSALHFSQRVVGSDSTPIELGQFTTLHVDRSSLRATITARLDDAVETVGRRRRGRPRTKRG
jgi:hypothetical protein